MANVEIIINNRTYKVTCDDGQEERLKTLAAWADQRVSTMAEELGQIGDTRLMLLSLLMICDEYFELQARCKALETATDVLDPQTIGGAAQVIDAATKRIQTLQDRLGEPS